MTSFVRADVLYKAKRKIIEALRDIPAEQRVYVVQQALSDLAVEEEMDRGGVV